MLKKTGHFLKNMSRILRQSNGELPEALNFLQRLPFPPFPVAALGRFTALPFQNKQGFGIQLEGHGVGVIGIPVFGYRKFDVVRFGLQYDYHIDKIHIIFNYQGQVPLVVERVPALDGTAVPDRKLQLLGKFLYFDKLILCGPGKVKTVND
jgi:hypothetical protein